MATVTRHSVGLRSERGPLLGALMLATALVALDSTIIATAVPSIVSSLGGFTQFPWLFSIYLLAQAVSTPIYGRLADVLGRKPVMLAGIGLFLLGSVLCGVAWSMPALIAFRALQGLGAGAVLPMSNTIAGDVYTLAERAKVQGYLASVWGISAVVGTHAGRGVLGVRQLAVDLLRQHPAVPDRDGGAGAHLQPRTSRGTRGAIDYPGAALLAAGVRAAHPRAAGGRTGVVLGVGAVGRHAGRCGAALVAGFVAVERRVAAPILPLWVFTRRVLLASSLVAVAVGAVVLGLTSYVPTFAQGVLGAGPVTAGFALATLTVGWPIAAALSGTGLPADRLPADGAGRLGADGDWAPGWWSSPGTPRVSWFLAAACFVTGLGMGFIASPTLIAAQSSVGWEERGVVTGSNLFSRSLGSALAVAVLGAIANSVLGDAPPSGVRCWPTRRPQCSSGSRWWRWRWSRAIAAHARPHRDLPHLTRCPRLGPARGEPALGGA